MTNSVAIRKAALKDVEQITEYNILMAKEIEDKDLDRAVVLKGVKAVIEDPHKGFYLIANKIGDENEIIGQLMITFEWSDWRNHYFWWMQSVYVDKSYRNQNIFTNLYQELLRLARLTRNVCGLRLYVEEHNESAKKVYEALGMNKATYKMYEMLF